MEGQESGQTITLKTGKVVTMQFVRDYLIGIIAAENSGVQFPIDFDDLWEFAFAHRSHAVSAFLAMQPVEEKDYRILTEKRQNSGRGRPTNKYWLSVEMAEHFLMQHRRDVREIYVILRKEITDGIQGKASGVPSDFGVLAEAVKSLAEELKRLSETDAVIIQMVKSQEERIRVLEAAQAGMIKVVEKSLAGHALVLEKLEARVDLATPLNLDGRLDPAERDTRLMSPESYMRMITRVDGPIPHVPSDLAEWARRLVAYCKSHGYPYTGHRPRRFPVWLFDLTIRTMGPLSVDAKERALARRAKAKGGQQMGFDFGRDFGVSMRDSSEN